jgi:predicted GNAT family acetyltransferase
VTPVAHLTHDLEAWAARVAPVLGARPTDNHVLATVLAHLRTEPVDAAGAVLAWVTDGDAAEGEVSGAALRTPPHPLLVSALPAPAARALAAALHDRGLDPDGVAGPEPAARLVAEACAAAAGTRASRRMAQRIHVLDRVAAQPAPPPGGPRALAASDRAMLVEWLAGFGRDIGLPVVDAGSWVAQALADGRALLWDDGEAACLVRWSPEELGLVRVVAVYTPPERRGRGYAQALVAEVARRVLALGTRRLLIITDVAQRTPRGVYERVGFSFAAEGGMWAVG